MTITREQIAARLVELQTALANTGAEFDRLNGAILDCQHWLKQLDAAESVKPGPKPVERVAS